LKPVIEPTDEISTETELVSAIKNLSNYNLSRIWINQDNLTNISQQVYGDWNYITHILKEEYNSKNLKSRKQSLEKYNEKREKDFKRIKEYSLAHIETLAAKDNSDNKEKLFKYFTDTLSKNIEDIKSSYTICRELLSTHRETGEKLLLSKNSEFSKLRDFIENMKSLQTLIKTFIPKSTGTETDDLFYNALNYEILSELIPVYNKVRNYVTQKPYSIEKFPLTFNCPTLLDGWDLNKEENNLSTLFEKDGYYYLGIMNKKDNKIFKDIQLVKENEVTYNKFEYKLLPGPNKMLPKVFFSESRIEEFKPTDELLNKYKKGCHKKGSSFDIYFCRALIDFYKKSLSIHQDWSQFNFKFDNTSEYQDISKFYRQVEEQGYKISTVNISENYINSLVEDGKLFLFKIYNKDFSEYSKGTPNLHTLYWKALFDEDNLKDVVYQLNGGAEIFYRKKSIEYKVTHPKNQPIKNKNELNHKKESNFAYDLIKNKRFTMDKFLFHVPIKLNFKSKNLKYINEFVNTKIKSKDNINVIGIDRGERNLIYLTVINSKGEILEQISLNEIVNEYKGETYRTNYHDLLNKKEEERNKARKNWGTIENIKDLKEGYMSQVVHKITDLMLKYNAIIVLEDLNSGFKNSRKKVEKQVYDKFETMLINKLSYFVDKKQDKFKEGGLLNAYQLVNKDSKGKQSGVLFYIPAWNTSKIDPVTGFVNLFYLKNMSIEKAKEFFNKFEDIRYNKEENLFEFDFDYSKFADKAYGIRKDWTICTNGERIRTFKNPAKNNEWGNEEIKLSERFKILFEKYSIDLANIKNSIQNQTDKKFFDELIFLFKLTLQMRNSITNTDVDYILSPVRDKKGDFYDSRNNIPTLPKDADANGAYNIARKGLMLIDQIKKAEDLSKLKLAPITNEQWLTYVQEKNM
jgi:CRISPR-associated protein Cpf1